jgi:hypothetical protein
VNAWQEETTGCQEATETYREKMEANPEEIEFETEHEKVPKEDAAVNPAGALKKRHRGRHPAAGRRGQPKERTRGICGSRKKLDAARRWMARRAGEARRKGYGRHGQGLDNVARGTPKGRTFGKKCRPKPEISRE